MCYSSGKTGHINKYYNAPKGGNYGQQRQAQLNAIILEAAEYEEGGYEETRYEETQNEE